MMKYTGYGNCAGLLAQLGLLKLKDAYKKGDYSSDSEDSDTEEYTALKEQWVMLTIQLWLNFLMIFYYYANAL